MDNFIISIIVMPSCTKRRLLQHTLYKLIIVYIYPLKCFWNQSEIQWTYEWESTCLWAPCTVMFQHSSKLCHLYGKNVALWSKDRAKLSPGFYINEKLIELKSFPWWSLLFMGNLSSMARLTKYIQANLEQD